MLRGGCACAGGLALQGVFHSGGGGDADSSFCAPDRRCPFVALRRVVEVRDALRSKLDELEKHFEGEDIRELDAQLAQVFSVLRELVAPPPPPKKRAIGFAPPEGE